LLLNHTYKMYFFKWVFIWPLYREPNFVTKALVLALCGCAYWIWHSIFLYKIFFIQNAQWTLKSSIRFFWPRWYSQVSQTKVTREEQQTLLQIHIRFSKFKTALVFKHFPFCPQFNSSVSIYYVGCHHSSIFHETGSAKTWE